MDEEGYNKLSTAQAIRAAKKYQAKFIITRKPHTLHLNKIYENKNFILYKVSVEENLIAPASSSLSPDAARGNARDRAFRLDTPRSFPYTSARYQHSLPIY